VCVDLRFRLIVDIEATSSKDFSPVAAFSTLALKTSFPAAFAAFATTFAPFATTLSSALSSTLSALAHFGEFSELVPIFVVKPWGNFNVLNDSRRSELGFLANRHGKGVSGNLLFM
jgi:hypothetical protein